MQFTPMDHDKRFAAFQNRGQTPLSFSSRHPMSLKAFDEGAVSQVQLPLGKSEMQITKDKEPQRLKPIPTMLFTTPYVHARGFMAPWPQTSCILSQTAMRDDPTGLISNQLAFPVERESRDAKHGIPLHLV